MATPEVILYYLRKQILWTALAAIGTTGSVLFAIFRETLLEKWRRPVLSIRPSEEHEDSGYIQPETFRLEDPVLKEAVKIPGKQPTARQGNSKWLRIYVENSGRTVARNCICVVHSVRVQRQPSTPINFIAAQFPQIYVPTTNNWTCRQIERNFTPKRLHWPGNRNPPFELPRAEWPVSIETTKNVYPNEKVLCDLAVYGEPKKDFLKGSLQKLWGINDPNDLLYHFGFTLVCPEIGAGGLPVFPPGLYEFEIRIYAENCKHHSTKVVRVAFFLDREASKGLSDDVICIEDYATIHPVAKYLSAFQFIKSSSD
ncbi:MAG: hypothetical protein AABZ64_06680 [Nitrospinota bacterium]